jgi:methyl-accepting chemotaxis protein
MVPMIAGMAIIAWLGVSQLGEVSGSLDRMMNLYGKRNQLGSAAIREIAAAEAAQRKYLFAAGPEERRKALGKVDDGVKAASADIAEYLAIAGEYAKKNLPKAQLQLDGWVELDKQVRQLAEAGKIDAARELAINKGEAAAAELGAIIEGCYDASRGKMTEEAASGIDIYKRARVILWLITAASTLIGLSLVGILIKSVNRTMASIGTSIHHLEENSSALATAATDLASCSESLSTGVSTQAASLHETTAAIEQIVESASKTANFAESSLKHSVSSRDAALQGRKVVEEMVAAVEAINQNNESVVQQMELSNREFSEIARVIAEIGNKTKVINEIVFQTKLLSFNASVEAARAGEHGKGFAVVAEEVGNLATMSGNASKDISSLLESSVAKVNEIVKTTKSGMDKLVEVGSEKMQAGLSIARQCEEMLDLIVQNVSEVNQTINEISAASKGQAVSIKEIDRAVGELNTVTNENAAQGRRSSSNAELVFVQSEQLSKIVNDLSGVMRGDAAA